MFTTRSVSPSSGMGAGARGDEEIGGLEGWWGGMTDMGLEAVDPAPHRVVAGDTRRRKGGIARGVGLQGDSDERPDLRRRSRPVCGTGGDRGAGCGGKQV